VLFGDGAGAVVLKAADEPGIMGSSMGSDGSGAGLLMIAGQKRRRYTNGGNGVSANGVGAMPSYLKMNGPQIFRWATQMMSRAADKVIQSSGLKASDIDLLIPHQANARIMEATAKRLGMSIDKVFSNVQDYGNTSAASIPIAICDAIKSGRVHVGDNLVLTSFGAGLSWAAVALRWGAAVPAQAGRWTPIRYSLEDRIAAASSALRRQQWKVRSVVDRRFRKDE
jgi:3-oxoacyl-[acyl-carrier-protein] synthase III